MNVRSLEDLLDGRTPDANTELLELTDNPTIAPSNIFPRHTQYKIYRCRRNARPASTVLGG